VSPRGARKDFFRMLCWFYPASTFAVFVPLHLLVFASLRYNVVGATFVVTGA